MAEGQVAEPTPTADNGGEGQVAESQDTGSEPSADEGADDGTQTSEGGEQEQVVDKRSALQAARERGRKAAERFQKSREEGEKPSGTPVRNREGRLIDPKTGKYVDTKSAEQEAEGEPAQSEEGQGEEAEGESEAAGEKRPTEEGDPTSKAGEKPADEKGTDGPSGEADEGSAEKWVTVPLDEGHPLREQGRDSVRVHPDDVDAVRAMHNGTYVRRKELEELQKENMELRKENVRKESLASAREKLKNSETYKQALEDYREIKEIRGPEAASRYWQSMQTEFKKIAEEDFEERWGEVEQKQAEKEGERWVNEALERTQKLPQEVRALPQFPKMFEASVLAFDAEVTQGVHDDVLSNEDPAKRSEALHQRFSQFFVQRLNSRPEVRKVLAKRQADRNKDDAKKGAEKRLTEQDEERIRQEAIENYKKEIAEKRNSSPPHPIGRVGTHGSDRPVDHSEEESGIDEDANPLQVRKQALQRARQAARRRFSQ